MNVGRGRGVLLAAAVVLTALPFALATTFTGDDHVFLAFARHAHSPLVPFVADQHGGEYYRPVPMMLWWLLGRAGHGAVWPFAALGLLLHLAVAAGVGALVWRCAPEHAPRRRAPALLAATLFLLAPATRDAALWFSASTDLLASAGVLGSILLLLAGRRVPSAALALVAYLSKESAFALPLLAYLCVRVRRRDAGRRAALLAVLPHLALAAVAFVLRRLVLGGLGGAADQHASLPLKILQLLAGLTQEVTGLDLATQPLAWIGVPVLLLLVGGLLYVRRRGEIGAMLPVLWMGAAVLPLLAAGWPSGSRYFYLAAVGIAWAAADLLLRAPQAVPPLVLAAVVGLGLAQTVTRFSDISSYRARVDAVRRAVASGAARGHRVFHVDGGIKDVELAVKGWGGAVPGVADDDLVILGDVPASFAYLTPVLARQLPSLVARPPIPPSGAYRFGAVSIVGLARRGDEPSLDEVLRAVPGIRFVRLRLARGGRVVWRDVTEELDVEPEEPTPPTE